MNKQDFENAKRTTKAKVEKTLRWLEDNPEVVIVLAPIVLGGTFQLAKLGVRRHNLSLETNHREKYVYDRSLGHYWELRRKLSNNEWVAIETRRRRGESLGKILGDMKVLR